MNILIAAAAQRCVIRPMRKMKRRYIGVGVVAALIGIWAYFHHAHTDPKMIRWKMGIIGPRAVYGTLAFDDKSWEFVTSRVKSGDPVWLHFANDFKPFLDTHPGEEMMDAVSRAIDSNPKGALSVLLPTYGAKTVCAENWEGEALTKDDFLGRLKRLKEIPEGEIEKRDIDACAKEINTILMGDLRKQWPG